MKIGEVFNKISGLVKKKGVKQIFLTGILISILIFCIVIGSNKIQNKKYGYFIKGPVLNYSHPSNYNGVLRLDNGNILILGSRTLKTINSKSKLSYAINSTPNEIYNINTNKIYLNQFDNNIMYYGNGILLKENKILLTHVSILDDKTPSKNSKQSDLSQISYNLMGVINLNNLNLEKTIVKQMHKNTKSSPNGFQTIFLNNGKIFTVDCFIKAVEVFDIENSTSKILPYPPAEGRLSLVAVKNDVFIFADGNVFKYNYSVDKITKIAEIFKRKNPIARKINDNEILIIGGEIENIEGKNKYDAQEIEIYNIKENKSRIVQKTIKRHHSYLAEDTGFDSIALDDSKFLILGGKEYHIFPERYSKKTMIASPKESEIFDFLNNEIKMGPMALYGYEGQRLIKLDNGDVLVFSRYNKKTQIFKIKRKILWNLPLRT